MCNATDIHFLLTDESLKTIGFQLGYFITLNCAISAIIGSIMPNVVKFVKDKCFKKPKFKGLG